jgi:uncharacterized membrane protein
MANGTSYLRALGIGFVAGLRSMTAPAAVSWAANNGRLDLRASPLAFLGTSRSANLTPKLALGEVVADKMPFVPSRLKPASLIWRMLSGGSCGVAITTSYGDDRRAGAALGVAGALVASLLGYAWRTQVRRELHLPDFPSALLEDALAVGIALAVVSSLIDLTPYDAWADEDNPAWLP